MLLGQDTGFFENGRSLTTKSIVTLFQTRCQGRFKIAGVKITFYQNNISKVRECINKRQETVSNYHMQLLRKSFAKRGLKFWPERGNS